MREPYFTGGGVTLYQGDCLEIMPALTAGSMDAIVTDPPYYKVLDEGWDRQWESAADYLGWIGELADAWRRLLAPNGSLYCFASPQMAGRVECALREKFNILNHIVWSKPAGTAMRAHREALRRYLTANERIIFAEHYGADSTDPDGDGYGSHDATTRATVFEPLRAYMDGERERAGVSNGQIDAVWRTWKGCRAGGMSSHWFSRSQWELPTEANYLWLRETLASLNSGGAYLKREYDDLKREYDDLKRPFNATAGEQLSDVWRLASDSSGRRLHPAEKPEALMRHILNVSTRTAALVLDPFAGSGTAGVACVNTGRRCILIEREEQYCEIAARRLQDTIANRQGVLIEA